MIDYNLLTSEAEKIGVNLGEYGADRFDVYAERLVRWNEHTNLTAITEPDDIVIKHFIDSLYPMKYVDFKAGLSIKDVLSNIGIIAQATHERAEDAGKNPDYREQYDYVTARAVAPLNVLCEYCIPLVKVGGVFVSLKGANGMEELEGAKNAIDVLGGEVITAESYKLPNGDSRTLFVIKKISQTPTKYPRKPKKIDTRPL